MDQEECFTALMFAASEGHAEVVRILLENGSDPAMVDADGETALDFAMGNRHTGVVSLLQNLKQVDGPAMLARISSSDRTQRRLFSGVGGARFSR